MLLCALVFCALAPLQTPQQESLGPGKELKILYAGAPGDEREARFLEFLEPWFAKVDPLPLTELDAKSAADYDVVIVDWKRQYDERGNSVDGEEAPRTLGKSFPKPVVLIGAAVTAFKYSSKLDWL